VAVGDERTSTAPTTNKMRVGEYFGEISLIYGCKTTARITARKYCNFATLTKKIFEEVTMQFPGIRDAI
tara:strand:+ start:62 stop:268 length:207 start_codon:yes stop_codon:yes gene_type:complete